MKMEIYVPSEKEIKVNAARNAATNRYNMQPDEIKVHSMSLSEDGKRATQPVAIFGNRGIRKAAEVRIKQMEEQLGTHSSIPDTEAIITAQESGLKVNIPFLWFWNGVTSEATVTVAKDRRTNRQVYGVSEGVKVKLTDIRAILNPDLSVWHEVIRGALRRQSREEEINDIDWYNQYDKKNPSRAECVQEATEKALRKL